MNGSQDSAARDLEYIRRMLERTQQRIDPHAFHFVHWGAIVLVWYPLMNYFEESGQLAWRLPVSIVAIALGTLLSFAREIRLSRAPRLAGENTYIGRQVGIIVAGCIGAGVVLSGFAPATGFVDGPEVPVIWGLVYSALAFMTGVVYTREFLVSGVVIFAGTLLAMAIQQYNGFILGPFMGLGMIIPGLVAERRVTKMQEAPVAGDTGTV
ncbi:MAG: hypothetical protein L0Z55_03615 [Planctomycetes bacterium]|nr:hypothetical protein [Planctomycetota bacterium]